MTDVEEELTAIKLRSGLRTAFCAAYSYLCGFAQGGVAAGGEPYIHPETLRDLEQRLMEDFGMTEAEVLLVRNAALNRGDS